MPGKYERKRVLITVKTYPHPSEKYIETVCTAGITEDKEWVRLYPIDFRYRDYDQQYRKYQWIELDLMYQGHKRDNRIESYRPNVETIMLKEKLTTDDEWRDRRRIIDNVPHYTLNELKKKWEDEKTSLGIVKPKEIKDLIYTPVDPEWSSSQRKALAQELLFDNNKKPLRKIPFKFQYVFTCEDNDLAHKASITDWELGALFLNEYNRYGNDQEAAESVKNMYLNKMCAKDKDVRFFMGTIYPFNTWIVLGVFWPPKQPVKQGELFD